jgi:hypothetical protein
MKTRSIIQAIIFSLLAITVSCSEEKPGPISVENEVSPQIMNHDTYGSWTVTVTNAGGEVEMTRIHAREEVLSGPFKGQVAEIDLNIGDPLIDAHESEVVHNDIFYAFNTTGEDCQVKNTVTVYSDGGSESDDFIYTIKPAVLNNNIRSQGIKSLLQFVEN